MSANTITNETASGPSPETEGVSEARALRFYDRLRERIHSYVAARGRVAEKSLDLLLLAPDMFILLFRLITDGRVNGKNKVLLGSGMAYFFFPLDVVPELFLGPIGFFDDLLFAVFILNKMLADTTPELLRQHWSGNGDLLESIRKVLRSADQLVATDALNKIKRMVR